MNSYKTPKKKKVGSQLEIESQISVVNKLDKNYKLIVKNKINDLIEFYGPEESFIVMLETKREIKYDYMIHKLKNIDGNLKNCYSKIVSLYNVYRKFQRRTMTDHDKFITRSLLEAAQNEVDFLYKEFIYLREIEPNHVVNNFLVKYKEREIGILSAIKEEILSYVIMELAEKYNFILSLNKNFCILEK